MLIILLRHKLGFSNIEEVQQGDPRVEQLIEAIVERCISITGSVHGEDRGNEVRSSLQALADSIVVAAKQNGEL